MYQTPPFTEYSPYFIIQHNVQYFTGGYSIKTAEVAYYDKTFKRNKNRLLKPYCIIQVTTQMYRW